MKIKQKANQQKGFTLLEILLVVAAIAILAGIVILALNPAKQLAETRNSQRWADVNTILNAVYQYSIDNNGTIPASITATETEICSDDTCDTFVDLTPLTTDEVYLVGLPGDPSGGNTDTTTGTGIGYTITRTANDRVTVNAPGAERGATISVTR